MGFKAKSKERGVKSDKAGEMLSGFGAEMKSEVGGSHFRFVKLAGNYCYYGEIGEKKIHVVVCICDFVHTMYDYSISEVLLGGYILRGIHLPSFAIHHFLYFLCLSVASNFLATAHW